MATGDAAQLYPAADPPAADQPAEVLTQLKDTALEMLARMDRTPASLRLRAADVELDMEWPQHPPAATVAVPAAAAPAAVGDPALEYVTASMVGMFFRAPKPGAQPFVDVGDLIAPGRQVGIIEAMKLMIPVESTVAGRIVEVLAADATAVEYGDRLFSVESTDN